MRYILLVIFHLGIIAQWCSLSAATFLEPTDEISRPASESAHNFGGTVVRGKFNSGSYEDLAVAAPDYTNSSGQKVGRIFIYHGGSAGMPTDPSTTIVLPNALNNTKAAIGKMVVGNLNNDAYNDLIVSQPYWNYNGGFYSGRVIIYWGSSTGLSANNKLIIDSPNAKGQFGTNLDVGDLNGDGKHDLVVSAPTAVRDGYNNCGYIHVFLYSGTAVDATKDHTWTYGSRNDCYKLGVQLIVCDLNKDGKADVLASNDTNNAMFMLLFKGAATLPATHQDTARVNYCRLLGHGDFTGDGRQDVAFVQDNAGATLKLWKGSSSFSIRNYSTQFTNSPASDEFLEADVRNITGDSKADFIGRLSSTKEVRVYKGISSGVDATPSHIFKDNNSSQGTLLARPVCANLRNRTVPMLYTYTKKDPNIHYITEFRTDAPYVRTAIPNVVKNEDFAAFNHCDLDTMMKASGTTSLSYSILSNSNSGAVSVSVASGNMLRLTPVANQSGSATVVVKANRSGVGFALDTFTVTVNAVNDKPVLVTPIPNKTKDEDFGVDQTIDLSTHFSDPEGATLSYGVTSLNTAKLGAALANGKLLKLTSKSNQSGTADVVVTCSDGSLSTSDTMRVTINPINDVPTITAVTNQQVVEDNAITLALSMVTATDIEGDPLTLQVGTGSNYTVTGLTVKPDTNFAGTLTVPLTVSDGDTSSAVKSMTITVTAVNDAPEQIKEFTFWGFGEDVGAFPTFKLSEYFVDPEEGTDITYSIDSIADSTKITATMNSENQVVVAPKKDQFGNTWVHVRATDSEGLFVTSKFEIRISNKPDKPVITSAATVAATEDILCTYVGTATDVDGDELTISFGNVPSWMSVVDDTISGTPLESVGDTSFTLYVNDGTYTESLTVAITVTPVNDAPVLTVATGQTILEDMPLEVTLAMTDASDAENDPLSLIIGAGDNYTVSGTTVTPTPLYNGSLSVPVTVTDGELNSATVTMTVTVTAVNNAPTLTEVQAQTVPEDTPLEITLAMTNATDPDGTVPSLIIGAGDNYTVSGTTITPAANFHGALSIPVQATDGLETTSAVTMSVTVTPVNDAPTLTEVSAQTANEDTPLEITLAMTNASDVDGTVPSLVIGAGDNYTVSGTTITPAANFHGALSVPVQATDGTLSSEAVVMSVTVAPVNDAPTMTVVNAQTILEGGALTVTLAMTDGADVDGDLLSIVLGEGENYTVTGAVVTPTALFNGTLTVPVTISDGLLTSATVPMTITVTEVNNAPTLTEVTAQTVAEDTPLEITLAMTNATDPDGTLPSLIIGAGANYTVSGTTITPAANFNGALTVPVQATDGLETTAAINMTLTVTPVNDAPTLSAVTIPAIEKNSDVTLTLAMTDAADVDGDPCSILIGAGDNYTVVGMTIIPTAEFIGDLLVPITVTDGLLNSATVTATVTVIPGTAIIEKDVKLTTAVTTLVIAPNPVSAEDESVQFIIPEDIEGELSITVYDMLGNMIDQSEELSGTGVVYQWDLRNRYGNPVAAGTYVAICTWKTADGETMMKKLIGVRR